MVRILDFIAWSCLFVVGLPGGVVYLVTAVPAYLNPDEARYRAYCIRTKPFIDEFAHRQMLHRLPELVGACQKLESDRPVIGGQPEISSKSRTSSTLPSGVNSRIEDSAVRLVGLDVR
ncbi:MAG: hypothetical protein V4719_04400 [Planctomycetota bacterium]